MKLSKSGQDLRVVLKPLDKVLLRKLHLALSCHWRNQPLAALVVSRTDLMGHCISFSQEITNNTKVQMLSKVAAHRQLSQVHPTLPNSNVKATATNSAAPSYWAPAVCQQCLRDFWSWPQSASPIWDLTGEEETTNGSHNLGLKKFNSSHMLAHLRFTIIPWNGFHCPVIQIRNQIRNPVIQIRIQAQGTEFTRSSRLHHKGRMRSSRRVQGTIFSILWWIMCVCVQSCLTRWPRGL